jgi:hypothetical protein
LEGKGAAISIAARRRHITAVHIKRQAVAHTQVLDFLDDQRLSNRNKISAEKYRHLLHFWTSVVRAAKRAKQNLQLPPFKFFLKKRPSRQARNFRIFQNIPLSVQLVFFPSCTHPEEFCFPAQILSDFDVRISFGFRVSDFGFGCGSDSVVQIIELPATQLWPNFVSNGALSL